MEIEEKQKNILLLLFSVVGIGIVLSVIASMLFTEFYSNNKVLFCTIWVLLLLANIGAIFYLSYHYDNICIVSTLPIVYDEDNKKFIDIPCTPASIHARVLFNNLSDKQRNQIRMTDSDFMDFCNSFVVQYIFSLIFHNSMYLVGDNDWNEIDRNYIKDLLVNFKYLDIDSIVVDKNNQEEEVLKLPKGISINKADSCSLLLVAKQGYIKFSWSISVRSSCGEKMDLLAQIDKLDLSSCTVAFINVKMEYGYNTFRLFKRSTKNLDRFFNCCKNELKVFDINTGIDKVTLKLMKELLIKTQQ